MKKFISLLLVLFLTGCTATYNLNISNNKFNEKIYFSIYNSDLNDPSNMIVDGEIIENDNPLISIVEGDLIGTPYKRKIVKYTDYSDVELKAKYNKENFKESTFINMCFDNAYINLDNHYEFSAYGSFNCLNSGKVDIKIKTFNKVLSNNADEKHGNTYIWHIDEQNKDNIDIEIKIDEGLTIGEIISKVLAILAVITLVIVGIITFKKNREINKV